MSNPQVRPQAEEEPALIEAAREAANEVLEAATEVERHIEKGTPQFMRTSLALFSGGFATFALLYCIQPMMPVLSKAFSISAAESSLALSVATAMLALGLLVTGPISDAIGRKPVMVVSLLAAALFTLGSAVMPTWHGVLLMRALVGLSLSGLAAVAMTYLSEEIHPQHIGLSMGLYIGGNAIGGMSGRLISGVLVDFISWHAALAVLGGLALVAALVFWRVLPESKHFRPAPLKPATLLNGYRLHFRDAGLPWLFLIGFLLMGSFVTLFNYIGYRLLAEPYHMSQAVVGVLSVVYLSGIWLGLGRLAGRQAGPAQGALGGDPADARRPPADPVRTDPADAGRPAAVHLRLLRRALRGEQLDRPPRPARQGPGVVAVPVQLLRRLEPGRHPWRGVLALLRLERHRPVRRLAAGARRAGLAAPGAAAGTTGQYPGAARPLKPGRASGLVV